MYIAFEGIDTCGKTTQIQMLKPLFPNAIFTKEPGGSAIGLKIREMILENQNLDINAEFFLFLADRAQHIKEVILPHQDKMVISDRSLISGIAYAQDKIKYAWEYNIAAVQNFLPQKIILFKIDRETLEARLMGKSHDSIEQRGIDYLLRIQDNLYDVATKMEKPLLLLEAKESREALHQKIVDFIKCDV